MKENVHGRNDRHREETRTTALAMVGIEDENDEKLKSKMVAKNVNKNIKIKCHWISSSQIVISCDMESKMHGEREKWIGTNGMNDWWRWWWWDGEDDDRDHGECAVKKREISFFILLFSSFFSFFSVEWLSLLICNGDEGNDGMRKADGMVGEPTRPTRSG